MLPPEQRDATVPVRYREHLKQLGYSDADADAQIRMVESQGARSEVEALESYPDSGEAELQHESQRVPGRDREIAKAGNSFGCRHGAGPKRDLAGAAGLAGDWVRSRGEGRRTSVSRPQRSQESRSRPRSKTRSISISARSRWDLILLSYVGARRAGSDALRRALKPGGVLVIEGFHRDATKGASIGGAVVFDTGELPKLYPQLRVVRYEEPMAIGDFGQQRVRLVRYCGERPE